MRTAHLCIVWGEGGRCCDLVGGEGVLWPGPGGWGCCDLVLGGGGCCDLVWGEGVLWLGLGERGVVTWFRGEGGVVTWSRGEGVLWPGPRGRGVLWPGPWSPTSPPLRWTDRCLGKHNLRSLRYAGGNKWEIFNRYLGLTCFFWK